MLIQFSDFCKRVYPHRQTGLITSQAAFVVKLFQAAGSTWALGTDETDEYAKKLYSGGTPSKRAPLTHDKIATFPLPFHYEDVYSFLTNAMDASHLTRFFDDFSLPEGTLCDFELFCFALTNAFAEFIVTDSNETPKSIEDFYLQELANPHTFGGSTVPPTDTKFILEVKSVCPLCGSELIITKGDKSVGRYTIVKIFPDSLSEEHKNEFTVISDEPIDKNAFSNKIAICKNCCTDYVTNHDVSQFKKLIETKRYIEKLEIVRESLKEFDPGDAYDKVIEFIQNAEMPDADELSLEAKKLRRKIPVEYNVLYKAIRDLARSSYKEIYDYLEKNEAKYTDGSTFIGRKIKTLSDSLMAKGLNPQEVYDAIVSALVSKFPDDKNAQNACYYLVAFFTVHCEVLNNETA